MRRHTAAYATVVSPTRPALGTSASAPSATAAPAVGLTGRIGTTDSHRGRGGGWRSGSLPGDRWLQAHCGASATGPGHRGSGGLADAGSRCFVAGPIAAGVGAGERAGTRLAAAGVGAALRLRAGRVGAAVRPQRELGVAAVGAGGTVTGGDPTASAGGQSFGARGDEVSGADGAHRSGGLPKDGRDIGRASLRLAASRATLHRLA